MGTDRDVHPSTSTQRQQENKSQKEPAFKGRERTQRAFSEELPATALKLQTSSGSLDYAVACAPPALEMTEGEGIAEERRHRATSPENGKPTLLLRIKITFVAKGWENPA
jgi:hypothetical protein